MDQTSFKQVMSAVIILGLATLSFFIIRPILLAMVYGVILAFVFMPIYNFIFKRTKMENFSAIFICVTLILIIFLSLWFFTPIVLSQSLKFYSASQQVNFIEPLQKIFPSFFASEEFSAEVGSILNSFVVKSTNSLVNSFANVILNFPTICLQLLVVFVTFFFVLRDKEKLIDYIKSLLPYSKEVENKIFHYTKGITFSVLYGQVVVGILQGVLVGIAFFVFGVSNALLLTLLATLAGIFPIIGTAIVWIPVVIFLFLAGDSFSATGVIIVGLISSNIDNILRPMIVSKRVNISSAVIMIGMIGGFFLFGILGFILGPLILAYLLIILEIYRDKKSPGIF